ncbi:MAG TPA: hypothetical protein VFS24_02865 [Steroidobacteraceae bacterium]|nr:hypothetical protein [Steroidobacteraceae bacterium]
MYSFAPLASERPAFFRCTTVMHVLAAIALVLWVGTSVAADFQDAGALRSAETCDSLLKAEESTGGQTLVPNPTKPVTLFTVKRLFGGDRAALVYVCNRDGRLVNRIVYMHFQSKMLAQEAFEKHREALSRELGEPCWNPDRLTNKQKDLLPGGDLASLPALADSVIWNGPFGQSISLHIREPLRSSDAWQVRISTDFSGVALNEVVRSIYRASGCSTQHLVGQ